MSDDDLLAALNEAASRDPVLPETDPEPACRLEGVSVSAYSSPILHEVSLALPAGVCTVIMGPSGSGKSTLLKTAAGLIPPDTGEVEILGVDTGHATNGQLEKMRARTGFVFQDDALWQNLSLRQNLTLPVHHHQPDLDPDTLSARIDRLLGEMGATRSLDQRPARVSAGERKIISFLRALVGEPELVFLDEPTTSIDGERTDLLIRKLKQLKEDGVTLITVTHNARLASQLADYVVVLKEGRVLRFGSLHDISRSNEPEVERILTDVLSETATYDGDILELLDPDTNTYLT